MEVDMLASFAVPDKDPPPRDSSPPRTLRRLVITVYDDLITDPESNQIAKYIQDYIDPELIEYTIYS